MKTGFTCTRNILCSLNVVYMVLGLLLIGVASWSKSFYLVASINIISGVITLGVFLFLISIVGLIGILRHHQILLFFYMVILLLVFIFQFVISCSCLAFNREHQEEVLSTSWKMMNNDKRRFLEQRMDCCGVITQTKEEFSMDANLCAAACKVKNHCFKCGDLIMQDGGGILKFLGGVGLIFSFSEIFAVWLVLRYRNQKESEDGLSSS